MDIFFDSMNTVTKQSMCQGKL